MTDCWICERTVNEVEAKRIQSGSGELTVHLSCFRDFGTLVKAAAVGSGPPMSALGLEQIARKVGERILLVHQRFPDEQLPLLAYLVHFDKPIPVPQLYAWLRENELGIENPSLSVLRLKRKGLVGTYSDGEARTVLITDMGRQAIRDYAERLRSGGVNA